MEYRIHRNLHTDFNIFEDGKLQERSYFIPFSSERLLKTRIIKTNAIIPTE